MNQPTTDTLSPKEQLARGTDAGKFVVTSGLVMTFVMADLVDFNLSFLAAFFSVIPVLLSGTAVLFGLRAISIETAGPIKEENLEISRTQTSAARWLLGFSLGLAAGFVLARAANLF